MVPFPSESRERKETYPAPWGGIEPPKRFWVQGLPWGMIPFIIVSAGMYAGIWILFWGGMTLSFPIYVTAGFGFLVGIFIGINFDHIIAGVNDLSASGEGGSTFGIMNFFPFIGAIVFQWLTGIIISWFPTETGYSAFGFQITFLFVLTTVVAAFVLFLRLPRFEKE